MTGPERGKIRASHDSSGSRPTMEMFTGRGGGGGIDNTRRRNQDCESGSNTDQDPKIIRDPDQTYGLV